MSVFPAIDEPVVELELFSGPIELVRRGLALPGVPGVYVVACGDCVAHIGTSGNLRSRVRSLAALGTHRGSAEVICLRTARAKALASGGTPPIRLRPLRLSAISRPGTANRRFPAKTFIAV